MAHIDGLALRCWGWDVVCGPLARGRGNQACTFCVGGGLPSEGIRVPALRSPKLLRV